MSQSHNQRFTKRRAAREAQTGTQLSSPIPITGEQLTLATLSRQVINVEDELRELSWQQQLNAERLHDMLVSTNSQITLLGEMQCNHSSASQSTSAGSQAVSRRIAGPQDPEILRFEERFNSVHNRSMTEKVERYVLGQLSLMVNLTTLCGKICWLFNNQKQSRNRSAEKREAMRMKARQQRCLQEKLKMRKRLFNKHKVALEEEFSEKSGHILARELMSEEESEGENSSTLVIQKPSW
ncbi:hypothetical protein EC973_007598 [Apophysomyces ossiformis]|uniref:Uncharacterized protein n=1 Tax=Apophysomyces ossiformis TaxID=679940 RepID=A0A8H7BNZ3_9FUNG|nr:hypothetical protein EC973_007598 [Apophysomyces ossiformis]